MHRLNAQQQQAIHETQRSLLVLAGAGTGKTRVITYKIAHLLEEGYNPAEILALTFTNKAAREMQDRIAHMVPRNRVRGLWIGTFHAWGVLFLKQEGTLVGLNKRFSIMDQQDRLKIIKNLVHDRWVLEEADYHQILAIIGAWKEALQGPGEAATSAKTEEEGRAALLYAEYAQYLQYAKAVDFDDLIRLPAHILQQYPEVLKRWQRRYRHIVVDEYQDTNKSQYRLLSLLLGGEAVFTVVGDDDQSVYAWRGADIENIQRLQTDFPDMRIIALEQNYRSTNTILSAANQVIAHNQHLLEKKLWSARGQGDRIVIHQMAHDQEEAEKTIHLLLSHKMQHKKTYQDYAILYRNNYQSRMLEQSLRAYGIPFIVSGGTSFFGRSEIKDLMAYLKLLVNPDDNASFLRIINTPRRGIGAAVLERLGQYAREREQSFFLSIKDHAFQPLVGKEALLRLAMFSEWIESVAYQIKKQDPQKVLAQFWADLDYSAWLRETESNGAALDKQIEAIKEFEEWINKEIDKQKKKKEQALEECNEAEEDRDFLSSLLHKIGLLDFFDRQEEEQEIDAVQLSTVHAAKGLEYPCVFLIGLEEGIFPHQHSIETDSIEEERRLFYVAMTRAQDRLFLSHVTQRKKQGSVQDVQPARFLEELPGDCVEWMIPSLGDAASYQKGREEGLSHLQKLQELLKNKIQDNGL